MKKVIITAKVHEWLTEQLQKKGFTIEYVPAVTYEELLNTIQEAEGLIVTTRIKIDKPMGRFRYL